MRQLTFTLLRLRAYDQIRDQVCDRVITEVWGCFWDAQVRVHDEVSTMVRDHVQVPRQ